MKLTVLYPQPTDVDQFESDYVEHLKLLHKNADMQNDIKSYSVTKFFPGPDGDPPYYQMFQMTFKSSERMDISMSSEGMKEVAADSQRISTGGAPTIMIGKKI